MSAEPSLPRRAARMPDETAATIVRLAIRQLPHTAIAERTGVHRHTVRRVLNRTRASLTINEDLTVDRAEAVAVYRELQRTAWEAIEDGRSPTMLLAEVRQAQTRIDTLLGLAPSGPDDPALQLAQFKAIVVSAIQAEAPELAPRLAQRLLSASNGRDE